MQATLQKRTFRHCSTFSIFIFQLLINRIFQESRLILGGKVGMSRHTLNDEFICINTHNKSIVYTLISLYFSLSLMTMSFHYLANANVCNCKPYPNAVSCTTLRNVERSVVSPHTWHKMSPNLFGQINHRRSPRR